MIFRSILLASIAAILGAAPALAQTTLTENINNTGIPRNAPALGLSNIYGLNPCSAGMSVGVTTPLFGIGGAVASIDKECETRNNAAVVITGLKDEVLAREILCQVKDIRDAAIRIGKPCLQDQTAPRIASVIPENPPAKVVFATPDKAISPESVAEATKPVIASMAILANAPVFCRVKNLEVSLYPECTVTPASAAPQKVVAKRPSPEPTQAGPTWTRPPVAPATAAKPAPDANTSDVQTTAARAQTVSYNPARPFRVRPAWMIENAAAVTLAPIPVAASPSSDRLTKFLARGAGMVAAGDIGAARLLFERAAAAGSGQAAVELGKTYDPVFLTRINAVGIQADPATADIWYRHAIALGDAKASGLSQLASQ